MTQPPAVTATGPLSGLRVIDVATVVAGPLVASLLGDFGADVIKVELPGRGDALRGLGPVGNSSSYWWAAESRNKRGITLDLRKPAGRELLLRLVAVSDVLVENFVPGTLESWALGPEVLRAANPRLVVTRVSGFGQTGPYRSRPGYDRVGAAFGGLWDLTGHADGEPVRPGLSVVDYLTGAFSTVGALAALYARDAGGGETGQVVEMALFEAVLRTLEFTAAHYSATGVVRQRVGNGGPAVPSGAFQTRDARWLTLIAGEAGQFQRLMRAIGRADLADDGALRTNPGRVARAGELNGAIGDWIATRDLAEVVPALEAADLPVAVSNTIDDVFADPHVAAREVLVPVNDPALGPLRIQGVVPKLSSTPGSVYRPAPQLGEHNEEVFSGLLGCSAMELAALQEQGVV